MHAKEDAIVDGPELVDASPIETQPAEESKGNLKDHVMRGFSGLKPFVIVSVSYILYTMTDGAVRMIVLLHAFQLEFTAWEVALMFTLYELAGVFTNLAAGLMGARWGIKTTLILGLAFQLAGLAMLFAWQEYWSKLQAIVYVTCAQMLCGVAKDLTKLGGKTVTKLVTPEEKQGRLFKLVSFITGLKNSFKGVGYFIGASLLAIECSTVVTDITWTPQPTLGNVSASIRWLENASVGLGPSETPVVFFSRAPVCGYYISLSAQCLFILLAFPWAALSLDKSIGRAKKENATFSQIFTTNPQINFLSLARVFLFGSRDLWFEVALPFFLRDPLHGLGWSRPAVGAFLAGFIIVYGQFQSFTPQFLKPMKQTPANRYHAALWAGILIVFPLYLGGFVSFSEIFRDRQVGPMSAVLVSGIYVFGVVFAVNSAIHSYLVVKYSEHDKAAMNIGFYYMANAIGRLTGTLVSGALYHFAAADVRIGFGWCFWVSSVFCALAAVLPLCIPRDTAGGLKCGCITCFEPPVSSSPVVEREMMLGDEK